MSADVLCFSSFFSFCFGLSYIFSYYTLLGPVTLSIEEQCMASFFPLELCCPFKNTTCFVWLTAFFLRVPSNNISWCSHGFLSFILSTFTWEVRQTHHPLTLSPGLSNWASLSHTRRLLVIQLAQSTVDLFLLYPSVHLILPPPSSSPKPQNIHSSTTWGAFIMSVSLPLSHVDDFKSELREQLPLIAGSAAAAVVFIVSLVAISIICSRWVQRKGNICKQSNSTKVVLMQMFEH